MASHAKSAFSLDAADGSPLAAVDVDASGNVGIGTNTPTTKLDVRGGPILVENIGDQADLLWLASERSWVFRQEGTGVGTALKLESVGGGGNKNFIFDTDGLVGIGTTAPTHTVHIASPAPTLALQDTDSGSQQVGYISYRDFDNSERAWVGYGTAGIPHFSVVNARAGGDVVLQPASGKVRLGSSGEYFAPGGEENLRIIRGIVRGDGSIVTGSGFECTRFSGGQYLIEYDVSFGGTPAVTVTAHYTGGEHRFAEVCSDCPSNSHQAWVYIMDHSEDFTESGFAFIAVGPR
jgi:hypothetical protein